MAHEKTTPAASPLGNDPGFLQRHVAKDFPHHGQLAALMLLTVTVIDLFWVSLAGWTVETHQNLSQSVPFLLVLLPIALIDRYRCDPRIRNTFTAAALFVLFIPASSVLDYLVVSTNAPLADQYFAAVDNAMGFDWASWARWVVQHPPLQRFLRIGYDSGFYQVVFVIPFLGMTERTKQLYELVFLLIFGALVTIAISAIIPAAGPWLVTGANAPFDASLLSHFQPLRDGTLRVIDIWHGQGLVSMPSYHAMVALFFIWAVRGTRLFPALLIVNVLMISSTPTEGGHYLVDVIGGVLCAGALIVASGRGKSALRAHTILA